MISLDECGAGHFVGRKGTMFGGGQGASCGLQK